MNLTVNREGKYAIVWMTNAEKTDDVIEDIIINTRKTHACVFLNCENARNMIELSLEV